MYKKDNLKNKNHVPFSSTDLNKFKVSPSNGF